LGALRGQFELLGLQGVCAAFPRPANRPKRHRPKRSRNENGDAPGGVSPGAVPSPASLPSKKGQRTVRLPNVGLPNQPQRHQKQLIRPVRGFKTLKTAYATIKGFEVMHALRKNQAAIFNINRDIRGEARLRSRRLRIGRSRAVRQ
jgi:hypothetical protein